MKELTGTKRLKMISIYLIHNRCLKYLFVPILSKSFHTLMGFTMIQTTIQTYLSWRILLN